MTPSEKDIYISAKTIITQYGDYALLEAMMRVERYRTINNLGGMRIWERIADAIEFMQMPENLTSETIQ